MVPTIFIFNFISRSCATEQMLNIYWWWSLPVFWLCVCLCLWVCVAPCHVHKCDMGFVGRAGTAGLGLAAFVPGKTDAHRFRNEVRLWCPHLSSPLHPHPGFLPPPCFYPVSCISSATSSAASSAGSGMLLSASLVWTAAATGFLSFCCAVWTKR